jgi:hypothetical protein
MIAFEPLVRLLYEPRSAALVASWSTHDEFYEKVGRFGQAIEAMNHSLNP